MDIFTNILSTCCHIIFNFVYHEMFPQTKGNKSLHPKPTINPIAKDDFATVAQETNENVEPFAGIFLDTGKIGKLNEYSHLINFKSLLMFL